MGSGDCSFISWPILYPVMAFGFTEKKKKPSTEKYKLHVRI